MPLMKTGPTLAAVGPCAITRVDTNESESSGAPHSTMRRARRTNGQREEAGMRNRIRVVSLTYDARTFAVQRERAYFATMSSLHLRPELTGVPESPMVLLATEAEQTPGAIKLCYGESDMPTPEFICRAAYEASLAGHAFYTNPAGYPELRSAIAAKIHELH